MRETNLMIIWYAKCKVSTRSVSGRETSREGTHVTDPDMMQATHSAPKSCIVSGAAPDMDAAELSSGVMILDQMIRGSHRVGSGVELTRYLGSERKPLERLGW